jgi:general secretion pathway protein D
MGQDVPIPTTVFQSAAAGGVANVPTTSVQYQPVGVNLKFTPMVTYQDEIVLADLVLEKSGLGGNIDVGGQSFPTIVSRKASTSIRLRDGESTLIAGLFLDDDRKTIRSLPGLTNIPILRSIFGNSDRQIDQTDIVMIITPRIVRGHGLTADDVKPMYIGTGMNMTSSPSPSLLSPEALAATPGAAAAPAPSAPTPAPATSPIVPIQAAPQQARVIVSAPASGADGALPAGGGPHTMPIQIVGAADIATLSLTISYDPSVVRTPTVTQGSFMAQGGTSSSFAPGIDATSGRIDLAFTRPPTGPGASGSGLLAAISFVAGQAGTTDIRVTGVATTSAGQSLPIEFAPARVTVR